MGQRGTAEMKYIDKYYQRIYGNLTRFEWVASVYYSGVVYYAISKIIGGN
jgi:hypothetical protein